VPFAPTQLTGLSVWLDATDPLGTGTAPANGTSITTWADKSSSGNPATSAGTTPTFNSTSNAVVFGGAGYYNTNYSASLSNESLFVVYRKDTASQEEAGLIGQNADGGRFFAARNTNFRLEASAYNSVSGSVGPTNSITLNSTFIAELITTSGTQTTFVTGGSQGTSVSVTYTAGRTSKVGVGFNAGVPRTTQYLTGSIYEVNGYTTSLTPFDRQKVEGYLAWKWGLQSNLPTSHPFRIAAPLSNSVFAPTNFSRLQLWFDAQDATTFTFSNVSTITRWNDKSGNNRFAVGFYSNPIYSATALNNYPAAQLSSNAAFQATLPFGTTNTEIAAFVVFQKTGTANSGETIITRGTNNLGGPIDIQRTSRLRGNGSTQGNLTSGFDIGTATSPVIFNFYASANAWIEFTNGTNVLSNTTAGTFGDATNVSSLYIGTRADGFGPLWFTGRVGEVLVYNRNISTEDRQTVEGYLAWKWDLQNNLPSTHPYRFTNPGAVVTVFSPNQVTNLQLWLDAADTTTFTLSNVNTVTRWADKSGNGFHYGTGRGAVILSNDGARQVTYYNSNSDLLQSTTTSFNTTTTTVAFAVAKVIPSSGAVKTLFGYAGSDKTIRYGISTLEGGPGIVSGNTDDWSSSYFVNGSQDNTNGFTYTTYHSLDGTSQNILTSTDVRVGGWRDGTRQWFGTIAEILVYSSISAADRQRVQGYLSWKWGLQNLLPYSHPYKFLNPLNSTTPVLSANGLLIQFDANVYNGGRWYNSGSLGQTYNATIEAGTPTLNTAGNGVVFNGTTNFTFTNPTLGNAWSVSLWVKRTGANDAQSAYITQINTSSGATVNMAVYANYSGFNNSDQATGAFFNSGIWYSGTSVTLTSNAWIHMTTTWNGSAVVTYLNGVQIGSNTVVGQTSPSGTANYRIGRTWTSGGTAYIRSEIGQVLIYNRAITAGEVLNNYRITSNIFSV
jgi:hypothetical protein